MPIDLGVDTEVQAINNIGQTSTGFATSHRNFVRKFLSTANVFGTAATHTVGTASGNLVELNASNQFPVQVIPNISASKITSGSLAYAQGGTGYTGNDLAGLKTHLGIGSASAFDGNLTQDTLTLRSGSTTTAAADAKIVVERGTSGTDGEIRFLSSASRWELNDLNDGGTYKQILAANIETADRGKFLQVRTGSNIADWADLPEVHRNYSDTVGISLTASRNFIASGTTAADIIDHQVFITPNANGRVMTLTAFGDNGQGMIIRNASTQFSFSIAGLSNFTGNFLVAPRAVVELYRINSQWYLNDGFKSVAFSLSDASTNSIDDADLIPFRDTSGSVSQMITVSALKNVFGGGGSAFTPSQSNLYTSVRAIIVGGTNDDANSTITIREVPALPTQNPGSQFLRGDNTWAAPATPASVTNRLVPNTGTGVLKAASAGIFAFSALVEADIPSLGFNKISNFPTFADGQNNQVLVKSGSNMVWADQTGGGGGGGTPVSQDNPTVPLTVSNTVATLPSNYTSYQFVTMAANWAGNGNAIPTAISTAYLASVATAGPMRMSGGTGRVSWNRTTRRLTMAAGRSFQYCYLHGVQASAGLFTASDGAGSIALADGIHFTDASDNNTAKQTTFGAALDVAISRPDTSTSTDKQFLIRAASATKYTRQTGIAAGDITSGVLSTERGGTGGSSFVPRPVFEVHSTDYTVTNDDYNALIGINSDSAARTVTLPAALDDEFMCEIFLDGAGTNPVTISIPGGNIVQDASNEDLFTDTPDTVVLRQTGDSVKVHKLIPQNWWRVLPARIIRTEIPGGGTTGQALIKNSNTDYDVSWGTVSGGGGSTFTPSQSNLYASVSSIIQAGTNVSITRSSTNNTLTINASGGGGGGGGAEFPATGIGFLHRTATNVDPTWRALTSADLPTVAVTDGGTGATTAANARENLGIDDYDYVEISGNRALTVDDNNKLYDVDTVPGNQSISLTLPANPTDDIEIKIRKKAANHTIFVSAASGDTINGSSSSFDLIRAGDVATFRSIGTAGWVAYIGTVSNTNTAAAVISTRIVRSQNDITADSRNRRNIPASWLNNWVVLSGTLTSDLYLPSDLGQDGNEIMFSFPGTRTLRIIATQPEEGTNNTDSVTLRTGNIYTFRKMSGFWYYTASTQDRT